MAKLLVAAVLSLCVVLSGCRADACGNQIVSEVVAPDGETRAVLFQRDCGATTGFSTQISVMTRGEQPLGSGNAFVADDDHGAAAAASWGGPWAEMLWASPTRLVIRYDEMARVFASPTRVGNVRVSFEKVAR